MISTLVVDDDYRVATIHAGYVQRVPGFRVTATAHTAASAWQAVHANPPDLVLLDLYLPDEHGLARMRRIQAIDGPRPDIIVITAARDIRSIRTAMQLGAVHYLVKPFGFTPARGTAATRTPLLAANAGAERTHLGLRSPSRPAQEADLVLHAGGSGSTRNDRHSHAGAVPGLIAIARVPPKSVDQSRHGGPWGHDLDGGQGEAVRVPQAQGGYQRYWPRFKVLIRP